MFTDPVVIQYVFVLYSWAVDNKMINSYDLYTSGHAGPLNIKLRAAPLIYFVKNVQQAGRKAEGKEEGREDEWGLQCPSDPC